MDTDDRFAGKTQRGSAGREFGCLKYDDDEVPTASAPAAGLSEIWKDTNHVTYGLFLDSGFLDFSCKTKVDMLSSAD
jgi:hypothetical protein